MQTLNLIDKTKSEIDYTIDRFPDGQINIHLNNIDRKIGKINIICRITNNDDIIMLLMISDILKRQEIQLVNMYITYLLSARMDRVIDFDQPYTLKIVANIINSMNASSVFIQAPHSDKSIDLINNSHSSFDIFDHRLSKDYASLIKGERIEYVYPDAGAFKRYYNDYRNTVFPYFNYNDFTLPYVSDSYIKCTKKRDPKTNELSNFEISTDSVLDLSAHTLVVKDDLCDGGGTFIGIGNLLRNKYDNFFSMKSNKLVLCVTHMIQGHNAIPKLLDIFDEIWFTNSYKDWKNDDFPRFNNRVKIINVTDISFEDLIKSNSYTQIIPM